MAHIVDLSQYRKARKAPPRRDIAPVSAYKPEPHFFCQRCESEQFKLFSSGEVHCDNCGARMRNLSVSDTPSSQGAES
jgi:ribosomal protein L37AE/L43A